MNTIMYLCIGWVAYAAGFALVGALDRVGGR